jgi:hypothetical protein
VTSIGLNQFDTIVAPSALYQVLVGENFRLLTILAVFETDTRPISCKLADYELNAAPTYEALSCVWGSPGIRQEIAIDVQAFAATRDQFVALSRLRAIVLQVIWVDAICINQADVAERSQQVQHMAQIYSSAFRVVAWLGDAISNVELAFEVPETIAKACGAFAEAEWFSITNIPLQDAARVHPDELRHHVSEGSIAARASTSEWEAAIDALFSAA